MARIPCPRPGAQERWLRLVEAREVQRLLNATCPDEYLCWLGCPSCSITVRSFDACPWPRSSMRETFGASSGPSGRRDEPVARHGQDRGVSRRSCRRC